MSQHCEWVEATAPVEFVAPARPDEDGDVVSRNLDPHEVAIASGEIAVYGTPQQVRAWLRRALAALDAAEG